MIRKEIDIKIRDEKYVAKVIEKNKKDVRLHIPALGSLVITLPINNVENKREIVLV